MTCWSNNKVLAWTTNVALNSSQNQTVSPTRGQMRAESSLADNETSENYLFSNLAQRKCEFYLFNIVVVVQSLALTLLHILK